MAPSNSLPILDHIVILVSHSTLLQLPERLKSSFTVIVGGEHADGLTVNSLILFQDGVYIELIAFKDGSDPEKRSQHRWGQLPENTVIDWAYTLPHESDFAAVQARLRDAAGGYSYDDPVSGGRKRPDGEVLKWAVASARDPQGQPVRRGALPFWCLDRTPRELRVPYQDNPQASHASGARGVSGVLLRVPAGEDSAGIGRAYDAVHDGSLEPGKSWGFGVPSRVARSGQLAVVLDSSSTLNKQDITFTLLGGETSPSTVEILPGLVVAFEK